MCFGVLQTADEGEQPKRLAKNAEIPKSSQPPRWVRLAAGGAQSIRKVRVQAHVVELLLGDLRQAALLQKKHGSAAAGVFCCFSCFFFSSRG